MSRDATEPTTMRDKEIKPGEMIFLSPWLIQRHVTLWDRPDVFDPDRFSDPASKESQRSAHFPFSAGPHVCLGASFAMQEGILILACLARHFRFEALPNHTPRPLARLTLRSENGVRLRVLRRGADEPADRALPNDRGTQAVGCPFHN
jgi:cytochrome P450